MRKPNHHGEIVFSLAVIALVSFAQLARARDIVTKFESNDEETRLALYDASCTDSPECVIAVLSCGNGLSFEMIGFSDQDVGNWLLLNGALLTIKNKANVLPFTPKDISADEMNGGWSINFITSGDGKRWIESVDMTSNIIISNIQDDIILPAKNGDLLNLKSFTKACLRRLQ